MLLRSLYPQRVKPLTDSGYDVITNLTDVNTSRTPERAPTAQVGQTSLLASSSLSPDEMGLFSWPAWAFSWWWWLVIQRRGGGGGCWPAPPEPIPWASPRTTSFCDMAISLPKLRERWHFFRVTPNDTYKTSHSLTCPSGKWSTCATFPVRNDVESEPALYNKIPSRQNNCVKPKTGVG
jgi:hypothetical protein